MKRMQKQEGKKGEKEKKSNGGSCSPLAKSILRDVVLIAVPTLAILVSEQSIIFCRSLVGKLVG